MTRKILLFFFLLSQTFFLSAQKKESDKKSKIIEEKEKKETVKQKSPNKKKTKEAEKPKQALSKKKLSETELKKLHGKLHPYDALSLNFTESLYRKARKKTITKKGSAYIIKPNKFFWKAGMQTWIYDGKDLISHTEGDKHALRYSSKIGKSKELRSLVDMMTNLDSLLTQHTLKEAYEEKDKIQIKLEGKKNSDVESLEMTLEKKSEKKKEILFLKKLSLAYKDGNKTSFDFKEVKEEEKDPKKLSLAKEIKIIDDH